MFIMYENSTNKIESAEAKLIESLANLTYIIPLIFGVQLVLNALGYLDVAWSDNGLTRILINLIWVVFFLRIVPKLIDLIKSRLSPK